MKNLSDLHILVAGDIMLDHYIIGDVNRISPEAPVPITLAKEDVYTIGGCGNTIRNLRELGIQVSCLTSIGPNGAGDMIRGDLADCDDVFNIKSSKPTTQKIRIIGGDTRTQMLRIDRESTDPIECDIDIENIKRPYDAIIVSDYDKGVITTGLMRKLHELQVPIFVDPKSRNFSIYGHAFMITPNLKEFREMHKTHYAMFENILITKGKDGMELVWDGGKKSVNIPSRTIKVYNVSGAGDTVVAMVTAGVAIGLDAVKAARLSNECARYVVTQPGTSTVPKDLFMEILEEVK